MNFLLKIIILFVVCFVLFVVGVLIDSMLLSFLSIVAFVGCVVYLIISKSKEVKAKKAIKEQKENQERWIASLKPIARKETHVAGTKHHKQECDDFFKQLKTSGKLFKNADYGMTKKNMIDNGEYDEVFEYEPVDVFYRLEHEADNEYDSNAIKVSVSIDNENYYFVGYIPKKINTDVLSIIDIAHFSGYWQGRKYKQINTSSYGDEVLVRDEKDLFTIRWEEKNKEYYKYYDENGERI